MQIMRTGQEAKPSSRDGIAISKHPYSSPETCWSTSYLMLQASSIDITAAWWG